MPLSLNATAALRQGRNRLTVMAKTAQRALIAELARAALKH